MKPGTPPSPGHGGRRSGAGRPPKSEKVRAVDTMVRQTIADTLDRMRKVGITEELIRELALQGLATIYHHARRGNLKASFYLVDRLLGTPDKPFAEQAEEMAPAEVVLNLNQVFIQAGFTPETSALIVETLGKVELPETASPLALPLIPEYSDLDGGGDPPDDDEE